MLSGDTLEVSAHGLVVEAQGTHTASHCVLRYAPSLRELSQDCIMLIATQILPLNILPHSAEREREIERTLI